MPDLSPETVRRIEQLAHLRLSNDQRGRFQTQLAAILGHFAKLDEVDVTDIDPLAHPSELVNRLDRDQPAKGLAIESVLDMAPDHLHGQLVVPKVLDDSSSA